MPPGAACATARRFRGTSIPPRCWRRAMRCAARCGRSSIAPAAGRDTSSTWATVSSRRRRPQRWSSSWRWFMAGDPYAVIRMAYGGPEKLEDVEAYLRDVRGGRATSPELVEEIRGHYAQIGGGPPPRRGAPSPAAGLPPAPEPPRQRRLLGQPPPPQD